MLYEMRQDVARGHWGFQHQIIRMSGVANPNILRGIRCERLNLSVHFVLLHIVSNHVPRGGAIWGTKDPTRCPKLLRCALLFVVVASIIRHSFFSFFLFFSFHLLASTSVMSG